MKFPSLLPQEKKFYTLIGELSDYANQSAYLLVTLMASNTPEAMAETGQKILAAKTDAKKSYESMTTAVCQTFVTPFDREDIQAFADTLYNIPKLIEKIQSRILSHKLQAHNKDFNRMTDIIVREADALSGVIHILNNGQKLKEMHDKVAVLHELEDQGDRLLGQLITEAFDDIQDTRELILRKDIYSMLERVTDYYRDCANLALQIILKHS